MKTDIKNQIKSHKFTLPLSISIPRKTMADKKIILNQNVVKNLHHRNYSLAKKQFTENLEEMLSGTEIETPVDITYQVFKATSRKMDKMNVISVQSKFFLDALTYWNVWEDDNDDFVKLETLLPTELDRENPRCEIIITEINKRNA